MGTQCWSLGYSRDIMLLHKQARAASPGTKPWWDTFWETVSQLERAAIRLIRDWIQEWFFLCWENLLCSHVSDDVWYKVPNASVSCHVSPSLTAYSDKKCNANLFTLQILPQKSWQFLGVQVRARVWPISVPSALLKMAGEEDMSPPCLERCKQQAGQQPFQESPYWQGALCRLSVPFRERYTAMAKSPQGICVENTEQNQQNTSSANPKALKGLFEEEAAKPISHYGKNPRTACAFKQPIHFHKRSVYCSWHLYLVGIVLCLFKLNMREISLNCLIPISKVPRPCQT